MSIYCGKEATLEVLPPPVPRPDGLRILPSDFLAGAWGVELLSKENKQHDLIGRILEGPSSTEKGRGM